MNQLSASRLAEEKKAAVDVAAFVTNVLVSVLIVFVNKLLMDPKHGYGFVFATTLCALHFFVSGLVVWTAEGLGYSQPAKLPRKDTLYFSLIAGTSISTLNLSLLVNSVGFYQISKLLIIPFVCGVEAIWLKRRFTLPVICSVLVVICGVGIVTVTDVNVNGLGLFIAAISVVTSGMQQILCGTVQRKHNLTSVQLLSNTAPVQGMLLLVTGPFIDWLVSGKWVGLYEMNVGAARVLALSCTVAVAVNVSQFMCLGRFSAVTFQVLGHTKTILVLLVGWLYWQDHMSPRKLLGMGFAVVGMIMYGWFSSIAGRTGGTTSGLGTGQKGSSTASLEKVTSGGMAINGLVSGSGHFKDKADADLLAHAVEAGEARGASPARGYNS